MIKKVEGGYKVVSERATRTWVARTKQKEKPKSA
jgi:hypothetical protein